MDINEGVPPELQAEFEAWDRISVQAWAMIDDHEKLEELLMEGLDSGPSTPMTAQDWQDIQQEVRKRVTQRAGQE